jgi:AGCS family alanine or glycine:cation symporter
MEVFIVSFVTSTISAMTILLTGAWLSGKTSTAAVALAFDRRFPAPVAISSLWPCSVRLHDAHRLGIYGEQFSTSSGRAW